MNFPGSNGGQNFVCFHTKRGYFEVTERSDTVLISVIVIEKSAWLL